MTSPSLPSKLILKCISRKRAERMEGKRLKPLRLILMSCPPSNWTLGGRQWEDMYSMRRSGNKGTGATLGRAWAYAVWPDTALHVDWWLKITKKWRLLNEIPVGTDGTTQEQKPHPQPRLSANSMVPSKPLTKDVVLGKQRRHSNKECCVLCTAEFVTCNLSLLQH